MIYSVFNSNLLLIWGCNSVINLHYVQNRTLAQRLECSPMARETWVQSQVESYQRLKKWYLMPPCLALSIIRYGSRVKWSNPGKGVSPFPPPWCSSYRKGSLRVTLDYGHQLYLRTIASILIEKSLSLFLDLIKCSWNKDACILRCYLNSDVEESDCISYIKIMAF